MKAGDFGSNPNKSVHTIRNPNTLTSESYRFPNFGEGGSRSLFQSNSDPPSGYCPIERILSISTGSLAPAR
jgi:hypothetical protein